ncbi:hypothetical protein N7512_007018 [Penicillium capsulatum]|nr:hypothetical protein N7512_007018 [Penicillium capsulatum]
MQHAQTCQRNTEESQRARYGSAFPKNAERSRGRDRTNDEGQGPGDDARDCRHEDPPFQMMSVAITGPGPTEIQALNKSARQDVKVRRFDAGTKRAYQKSRRPNGEMVRDGQKKIPH